MFNEQVYNDFLREIQDNSEWLPLGKQSDDFEIHQHSAHMTRFKIRAEFDILHRPEWDEMCLEARIIEQVDANTRIQYTRAKAIFPLAARDSCNIFKKFSLPDSSKITIAHAVLHPACPEVPGLVRSEAKMIASKFSPHPTNINACIITQIIEIDPKGWVPQSVIKGLAHFAVPAAAKKLQRILASLPPSARNSTTEGPVVISSKDSGVSEVNNANVNCII